MEAPFQFRPDPVKLTPADDFLSIDRGYKSLGAVRARLLAA